MSLIKAVEVINNQEKDKLVKIMLEDVMDNLRE